MGDNKGNLMLKNINSRRTYSNHHWHATWAIVGNYSLGAPLGEQDGENSNVLRCWEYKPVWENHLVRCAMTTIIVR